MDRLALATNTKSHFGLFKLLSGCDSSAKGTTLFQNEQDL